MGKIQDYIVKNNIKPKECGYHTMPDTKNTKSQPTGKKKNAKGEPRGKIRVLVPPHSTTAMVEYTCPECKHAGYEEQEWKRPFKMKCGKCGFLMTVPKMKQEAKRDAKNAKK